MKTFKMFVEEMSHVLYHHSPRANRESIQRHGLLSTAGETYKNGGYAAVYLAKKAHSPTEDMDTWEVNTHGLHLTPDETTEPDDPHDKWFEHSKDIPPHRLKLVTGK